MKSMKLLIAVIFLFSVTASAIGREESDVSKTFKVGKGALLKVSLTTGDISINVWNKAEVSVNLDGVSQSDMDQITLKQDGNTILVSDNGAGGWSNNIDAVISVPAQIDLDVSTNYGDIECSGNLVGNVKASSNAGDLVFRNVQGKVSMNTNGGDIRIGSVGGTLNLSTSGGDIETGSVGFTADVTTMGGSIKMGSVGKDLTLSTMGGDINLGSVGGNATVSTLGGSISLDKVGGSASLRTNGGNIRLLGADGEVKAKTFGGNITLKNIKGSVNAYTSAGDVEIELYPSASGENKVSTMSGGIKLSLPSNAKATVEATVRASGGSEYDEKLIDSDFPSANYDVRHDEVHAVYQINGGGAKISLKSMNDKIRIRKISK